MANGHTCGMRVQRVQRVQKVQRGRLKGAKGRGWRRRLCRRVVFAFAHGALPQTAFITPSEPARSAGRTRRSARQRTNR